jgi:outer membrane protein assembly factor BamD
MMRSRLVPLVVAAALALPSAAWGKRDRYADLSDRQVYELGAKELEKENYYQARTLFERVVKRGKDDPEISPLVLLGLADSYFGKKGVLNLTEATSRYSSFLTFYPTHARADYAQYQLALCHFQQVYAADRDQKETRVALDEFRKVQAQFPESPYVDLAGEKLLEGYDLLAEHEFRVGTFYHEGGRYLGAIGRYLTILDRYPRYVGKDKVYYYLAHSLMRTERPEEGAVYLEKLRETYPDSEWAQKGARLLRATEAASAAPTAPATPASAGESR